jgi:hypothetical protein
MADAIAVFAHEWAFVVGLLLVFGACGIGVVSTVTTGRVSIHSGAARETNYPPTVNTVCFPLGSSYGVDKNTSSNNRITLPTASSETCLPSSFHGLFVHQTTVSKAGK